MLCHVISHPSSPALTLSPPRVAILDHFREFTKFIFLDCFSELTKYLYYMLCKLKYFFIFINVVVSSSFVASRCESVINTMYFDQSSRIVCGVSEEFGEFSLHVLQTMDPAF